MAHHTEPQNLNLTAFTQSNSSRAQNLIKTQFLLNKLSWSLSSLKGISLDENGNEIPWFTYPAIDFLKKILNQNHHIFEFGCGSSTIFFSKTGFKTFSLETNRFWFELIYKKLIEKSSNKIVRNDHFFDEKNEIFLVDKNIDAVLYCNFLSRFEKKFDFIIIDSMKRNSCVEYAIKYLKPEGWLILDDSQRHSYKKSFDFLEFCGFQRKDFWGIAPGQTNIKNTSFFSKKIYNK